MSDIIFSAFSDEYAVYFNEQLAGMKALDIGYIELRFVDGRSVSELSSDEAKELKNHLDEKEIKVSAIGSPLGKIRLDGDMKGHMEKAARVFEIANIMETKLVRVFSFYAPEGKNIHDCRDDVLGAITDMLALAKKYGVTLCHENEAKIYGDTPKYCRELLDAFGGELKCVYDMGNFVLEGVDPYPESYELLKKDIAYFHIKDALFAGAIVPPGKGDAKIKEILDAHKEYSKADFFVSLEPHLQTFSGLNALKGRNFDNPYKYEDLKTAFEDAAKKLRELT